MNILEIYLEFHFLNVKSTEWKLKAGRQDAIILFPVE